MKQHKIFIDAGGWYGAYYLGMFHYIFEEFGTTIFEDVYCEGLSAGSFVSGYNLATIYGCRDNRYWLELGQKRATADNNYGNARLTFGMYQNGKLFYEQLNEYQCSKIYEYYCGICMDSNLKPFKKPSFYPQQMTLAVCDELFEQGYNDAKKHKSQIRDKLTAFGLFDKNREIHK